MATTTSAPTSIWNRKLDLLHLIFFVTHIIILYCECSNVLSISFRVECTYIIYVYTNGHGPIGYLHCSMLVDSWPSQLMEIIFHCLANRRCVSDLNWDLSLRIQSSPHEIQSHSSIPLKPDHLAFKTDCRIDANSNISPLIMGVTRAEQK